MKSGRFLLVAALAAALGLASTAVSAEVTARISNGSLSFTGGNGFTNAVLTITGPNEFSKEITASRGLPVFRVRNSGRLVDGYYQYSLSAASDERVQIKVQVDNGRGTAARDYTLAPFSTYGSFVVSKGTIQAAEATATDGGADGDAAE